MRVWGLAPFPGLMAGPHIPGERSASSGSVFHAANVTLIRPGSIRSSTFA